MATALRWRARCCARDSRSAYSADADTVKPFTDKQIELVETFADQAVIAIENVAPVRRGADAHRDSRNLQQQTATADVLKVISRSTLRRWQTVLDTLVETAVHVCQAKRAAMIFHDVGNCPSPRALWLPSDNYETLCSSKPSTGHRTGTASGRAGHTSDGPYCRRTGGPRLTEGPRATNGAGGLSNASLGVPLLSKVSLIGVFVDLTRPEVQSIHRQSRSNWSRPSPTRPSSPSRTSGCSTRSRRASGELSQSVDELRALGEVSQAVNSTVDLETVLNTIVVQGDAALRNRRGCNLCVRPGCQEFHLRATYGMDDAIIAEIQDRHIHIGETPIGEAVQQRIPTRSLTFRTIPSTPVLDVIVRAGFRALLIVPLWRRPYRWRLVVRRKQPGEFPKHTVDLLQTFAAQSVLAIQNARLFENVEARTRELAESLEELRTAQDRLIQTEKLASLGQLTAGIAHEIKNPLNFVNNFSALSVRTGRRIGRCAEACDA